MAPRTSVQMLALSAACRISWPCCQGKDRYQLRIGRNPFAATVSKSTATAAPAPVVKCIQPAPTFQTAPATITRHEQGRHSRRVTTASSWIQRSFAVWSACESSSHFPGSKLIPAICQVVVSVLSWMIFLSAFSPVWVNNPWLPLCGHTIPLGFLICALV